MTVQAIPTFDLPSWTQTATLEGTAFLLAVRYSVRELTYYLDVADANGVDIYNGMKLMPLQFLMRKCKDPRRPAGDFLVFDASGQQIVPGLHDLSPDGGRCSLQYFTSDLLTPAALQAYLTAISAGASLASLSTYGQR